MLSDDFSLPAQVGMPFFTKAIFEPPVRVLYALLGVECLRAGEAAGLRWARVNFNGETLGRISVATSYDNDKTKTELGRFMPIHQPQCGWG